jgi:hypothetical protein
VGTPGGGDAGNPDGDLPGLPAEWGPIVIPDDLSGLADEVERVRAELRAKDRRQRWRRRQGRSGGSRPGQAPMRLPALILTVALFAAFAGLFTLGYGSRRSASPGVGQETGPAPTAAVEPRVVPALDLLDAGGRAVSVRSLLPAVILLTEGCACEDLIIATDMAAPAGTSVLVVARSVPRLPAEARSRVRPLADPAGELRAVAGLPATAARAGVLLATRSADIVRSVPSAATVDAYRSDLADLLAG